MSGAPFDSWEVVVASEVDDAQQEDVVHSKCFAPRIIHGALYGVTATRTPIFVRHCIDSSILERDNFNNYCVGNKRKIDHFQRCLMLALLSSSIDKNEQRFSKFTKHSAESESELSQLFPRPLKDGSRAASVSLTSIATYTSEPSNCYCFRQFGSIGWVKEWIERQCEAKKRTCFRQKWF